MILIKEQKTKKLPGDTSLFVSFEYNVQIIQAVKQSEVAVYHKKDLEWEVPLTSLSFLLD